MCIHMSHLVLLDSGLSRAGCRVSSKHLSVPAVIVSCHTCECVMSHVQVRLITPVNASYHVCECVVSHA